MHDSAGPVIVGVDGSESASYALTWAIDEGRLRSTPVEVICAWGPPAPMISSSLFPPPDPAIYEQAAKVLVEDVVGAARAVDPTGSVITTRAIRGYAPTVLLEQGARGLLVVGSRGRGGFGSLVLGSVSQHCATHTTAPMVLFPLRRRSRPLGATSSSASTGRRSRRSRSTSRSPRHHAGKRVSSSSTRGGPCTRSRPPGLPSHRSSAICFSRRAGSCSARRSKEPRAGFMVLLQTSSSSRSSRPPHRDCRSAR